MGCGTILRFRQKQVPLVFYQSVPFSPRQQWFPDHYLCADFYHVQVGESSALQESICLLEKGVLFLEITIVEMGWSRWCKSFIEVHQIVPQTASSCRCSGGFGRGASGLHWPPCTVRLARFAVKTYTKSMVCSKAEYFLILFREKVDFSREG